MRHITRDEEYTGIIKDMSEDRDRSARERQVEKAFGDPIPTILSRLLRECDGNRSKMCRRINDKLATTADSESDVTELTRGTLYNYLDKYDIG